MNPMMRLVTVVFVVVGTTWMRRGRQPGPHAEPSNRVDSSNALHHHEYIVHHSVPLRHSTRHDRHAQVVTAPVLPAPWSQPSQPSQHYTWTTHELGAYNPDAAIGNPLKGLMPSPDFRPFPYETGIPHALEFYYIGWKQVMRGNPDVVGIDAAFDWSTLERLLTASAQRRTHVVVRFYIHYLGRHLEVPDYLLYGNTSSPIATRTFEQWGRNETSPDYDDVQLQTALRQFIAEFGRRYDGDRRIAFVQAGLLGYWGEWHTWGQDGLLSDYVKDLVVSWWESSWVHTHVQLRYPRDASYSPNGRRTFGYHDDSFAYETLDGAANGGVDRSWYFWNRFTHVYHYKADFWKRATMGGETRVEVLHDVFDPNYPVRTYQKQDFLECVNVTHATYMLHQTAFEDGLYVGDELINARRAHARMGYNFYIDSVTAQHTNDTVTLAVTVVQMGVAPFYYDLSLGVACAGLTQRNLSGIETLIEMGDNMTFHSDLPATVECLHAVSLTLESSYAYPDRPIQFAQGQGQVVIEIPLPVTMAPVTASPTIVPTRAPTTARPNTRAPRTRAPNTRAPVTRAPAVAVPIRPPMAPISPPVKAPVRPPTPILPAPKAPLRSAPKAPVQTSPSAPVRTAPLAPVRTGPLAPVRPPPLAPVKGPVRAPLANAPKAPVRAPVTPKAPIRAPLVAPKAPVRLPTKRPTPRPTRRPVTRAPTRTPTRLPTYMPTVPPTRIPTLVPTVSPTMSPTMSPTVPPTREPSTASPTRHPTVIVTPSPTALSSLDVIPTPVPIVQAPTLRPTRAPVTVAPVAPTAPVAPALVAVVDLILVNTNTQRPIRSLTNHTRFGKTSIQTTNWTIQAIVSNVTHDSTLSRVQVIFVCDGVTHYHIDTLAPYIISPADGLTMTPWIVDPGRHTVTATPFYSRDNGPLEQGRARSVTFLALGWGID